MNRSTLLPEDCMVPWTEFNYIESRFVLFDFACEAVGNGDPELGRAILAVGSTADLPIGVTNPTILEAAVYGRAVGLLGDE